MPMKPAFAPVGVKILVSGYPCSGKTTFANWLRDTKHFAHIDLEDPGESFAQGVAPNISPHFIQWTTSISNNVVMTWGYRPGARGYNLIRLFERNGYSPWWFDADPNAAAAAFSIRDNNPAAAKNFRSQQRR